MEPRAYDLIVLLHEIEEDICVGMGAQWSNSKMQHCIDEENMVRSLLREKMNRITDDRKRNNLYLSING